MYEPPNFAYDYFKDSNGCFFVDVGAYDGISASNSYLLEKDLKWKGICIEPNPDLFQKLTNERNSKNYNCCISSSNKEVVFRKVEGYAKALSGILEFFEEKHINRINKEISKHGGGYEDIRIQSRTLKSILNENNVENVDYLSIDCEGGEYEILKSVDFEKTHIKLISIEVQKNNNRESDIKSVDLLKKNRYKQERRVCGDIFFSKK